MQFDPVYLVSLAIALLLGFTIHEFAHAWVANRLGDPTPRMHGRVTLNPLAHLDPIGAVMMVLLVLGLAPIAWGKPVPINPYYMRGGRYGAVLATAAGPLSNLLLALAIALGWRLIAATTGAYLSYGSGGLALISALLSINVLLASFNLLPIPPLDGFGILEGLAPPSWDRALGMVRQYGIWILLFLIVGGNFLGGFSVIWLLIGPLYLALGNFFFGLAGL